MNIYLNIFQGQSYFILVSISLLIGCTATNNITRKNREIIKNNWQPTDNNLFTKWAVDVDPSNTWKEYPRPQFVRDKWKSLNGLWNYTIHEDGRNNNNPKFENSILVPFPIESALSGVGINITPKEILWYQTFFTIPNEWNEQNIILHFGAIDWEANIWINEQKVGGHKGGYDPFYFDITDYVINGINELKVSVKDPTDSGFQPVGKQVLKPEGIFYTSVTGIWQSVWIEPVPKTYLESFKLITDIDNNKIIIYPDVRYPNSKTDIKIEIASDGTIINRIITKIKDSISISVPNPKLWSPDEPYLYDLNFYIIHEGEAIDSVKSYFGMRKVSVEKAKDGYTRVFLNNMSLFQNGPLDQGYWPDGLYTPPTDEAMKNDIQLTKDLGFNMLRKHVKVESDRFYYWCDKIGILVWQDMPNGDEKIGPNDPDIFRTKESDKQFEFELTQLINTHFNHPSIIMWVPFNEGWGQYKTTEIVEYVKSLDPTRLVNNASGWSDRQVGDVYDIHHYPNPISPEPESRRAIVLGEFGGLGLHIKDHVWQNDDNWGYAIINNSEKLTDQYESYYDSIWQFSKNGLSACVYTQLTDVETETNGLITYDRKVIKMDMGIINKINRGEYIPAPNILPDQEYLNPGELISLKSSVDGVIRYTTDGSDPSKNSKIFSDPIVFKSNLNIATAVFSENNRSRIKRTTYKYTDLQKPVYRFKYSDKYNGGGIFALLNGQLGSENYNDGKWQGFEGVNLDVTINLGKVRNIHNVKLNFLQSIKSWIFFPSELSILTSVDDINYTLIDDIKIPVATKLEPDSIKSFSAIVSNNGVKFIKIRATNIGECPQWHLGAGGKTWIFVDEIIIE